jgi:hypothetical protein
MVDDKNLGELVHAMTHVSGDFDVEIGLEALRETKAEPVGEPPMRPAAAPKIHKKIIRARKNNGGEWPPAGSIYSRVLEALEGGPKAPSELRDFLKASGFAASSVGSALNRLEKRAKVKANGDGTYGVAA